MTADITINELKRISEFVIGKIIKAGISPFDAGNFENGITVARMRFYGDFNGVITIVIESGDISAAAEMIVNRFGISVPVTNELVFAEFINMFAGNLITELNKKYDINISIFPPEKIFSAENISDTDIDNNYSFSHTITFETVGDPIKFKLNYYIKNSKDKIIQ